MVKLLVGRAGSGKTKEMIDLANGKVDAAKGDIIFINKDHRLSLDINHAIRVTCMEDFPNITNSDEYIGFIYGILSSNSDIETIFIDGILKHADVSLANLPEFIDRIKKIAKVYEIEIVVSLSAEKDEMVGVDFSDCEILN